MKVLAGKAVTMDVFNEKDDITEEDEEEIASLAGPSSTSTPSIPLQKRGRPKKIVVNNEEAVSDNSKKATANKNVNVKEASRDEFQPQPETNGQLMPMLQPLEFDHLKVGAFILAQFPIDDGSYKNYIRCILSKNICSQNLLVSYSCKRGNVFVYPSILDKCETQISWVRAIV